MYILLINIIPNHMRIFLPIIKIIVNYTLRITNRYCIQINEKQLLIKGAVYMYTFLSYIIAYVFFVSPYSQ